MTVRVRKLVGTIVFLIMLTVYVLIAMAIGANYVADAHMLLQVAYFLVAGLLWVAPAALLVRWMARPDPE